MADGLLTSIMYPISSTEVVYGLIRGLQAAEQQLFTPTEASKRISESSKTRSNPVAFTHINYVPNQLDENCSRLDPWL